MQFLIQRSLLPPLPSPAADARASCEGGGSVIGLRGRIALGLLPSPQPLSRPADERCVSQKERGAFLPPPTRERGCLVVVF